MDKDTEWTPPKPPKPSAQVAVQGPLPGFGPEPDDGFRFTWWNTAEGARVWVKRRGQWITGRVIGRGRKRAVVRIEAPGFKRFVVARPYSELRR